MSEGNLYRAELSGFDSVFSSAGLTRGPRDDQEGCDGTQEQCQKKPSPCGSISRARIASGEDRHGQS